MYLDLRSNKPNPATALENSKALDFLKFEVGLTILFAIKILFEAFSGL